MKIEKLTGEQWKQFSEALLDAFPDKPSLARAVRYGSGLNRNFEAIAGGNNLTDVVYYLLQWAQAQGKLGELVVAVQNENPGNPALRDFAESIKLAAAPK